MKRGFVLLLAGGVAVVAPLLSWRISSLEQRLETEREIVALLARRLGKIQAEVPTAIETLEGEVERARSISPALVERLGTVEGFAREASTRLTSLDETFLESKRREDDTLEAIERLRSEIGRLGSRVDGVAQGLTGVQSSLAEEDRARQDVVAGLEESFRRDPEGMFRAMISPTIQITGEETVGSGVLVHERVEGGNHELFALTAYHVIRNILSEGSEATELRVVLYGEAGAVETQASLLAHDEENDLALLRIVSDRPAPALARFVSPERLASLRVFTPVYTVGCPLGNDPIPTFGEIASTRSVVQGQEYWMVNAPAYFGNSGGGIFLASTRELTGLYSKIYTHGRGRPTVISHMGLVTPLDQIRAFLSRCGYGFVADSAPSAPAAAAGPRSSS
jgi:S1-C subfamily serine protease